MNNTPNDNKRVIGTDLHMETSGTAFDYSHSTRLATLDSKWLTLTACLMIFILDIAAFIFLLAAGYEFTVALIPMLFAICDVAFALIAWRVSFKFRYAKWYLIAYFALVAVLLFVTVLIWMLSSAVIMSYLAASVLIVVHVVLCLLMLFCIRAAKGRTKRNNILGGILLGAMLCISLVGTIFCYTRGFFGQAVDSPFDEKTVIYTYNKATDTYTASSYLTNKGDRVTIPASFNGKDVAGIDTAILADDTLVSVTLLGKSSDAAFVHTDADLADVSGDLIITTDKASMDGYRRQLISLARTANQSVLFTLANQFTPSDLAAEEHMVIFTYPFDRLDAEVIDQCVLSYVTTSNQAIHESELTTLGACFRYYKPNATEEDLLCYSEFNDVGYYVSSMKTADDRDFVGATLTESVTTVSVGFERFLHISFPGGASNDTHAEAAKYTIQPGKKYNDVMYDRYTSDPAMFLSEMVPREGFTYTFDLAINERDTTIFSETGLSYEDALEQLNLAKARPGLDNLEATMKVNWALNVPGISQANKEITYGDDLELKTNVTEGEYLDTYFAIYNKEGASVVQNETANISVFALPGVAYSNILTPDASGTYRVTATVKDPSKTDLVETVSCTFDLTISQKKLTAFNWFLDAAAPETITYNAQAHTITFSHDAAELVGDDAVTIQPSVTSIRDAGTHAVTLSLSGTDAKNYTIDTSATGEAYYSFKINPKPITSTGWNNTTFTYNGKGQSPVITGLVGVETQDSIAEVLPLITYTYDGAEDAPKNAATHTVTAQFPSGSNYIFSSVVTTTYAIEKKVATVTGWENISLTYNGKAQSATVASLDGLVDTDALSDILKQIIYTDTATQVGSSYVVKADLAPSSNYTFEATATSPFSIVKRVISVSAWNAQSFTYNGAIQSPVVNTMENVVAGEESAAIASLKYSPATSQDVGLYSTVVILPDDSNYMFDSVQECTYDISYRTIRVTAWQNTTVTYDAVSHCPVVSALENVVVGEEELVKTALVYSTTGYTNAGNYTVTVTLPDDSNYKFVAEMSTPFTIQKRETAILAWTTDPFTYDGYVHSPKVSSLSNVVEGEAENLLLSLAYTGAAQAAGQHRVSVSIPDDSNYALTGTIWTDYTIAHRPLQVSGWSSTSLAYTGAVLTPTATAVSNAVSGEESTILAGLTYTGGAANVGRYTVTAVLPANSNYVFESEQSIGYSITPLTISVNAWGGLELVYNGQNQHPWISRLNGVVTGEESKVIASLIYTGDKMNVGSGYTISVSLPENSNYLFSSTPTATWQITPKPITISGWNRTSFVYNGLAQCPTPTTLSGVVGTDDASALLAGLTYSDEGNIDAGTYTRSATLASGTNYMFSATQSITYTITKRNLAVSAWSPLSFLYDGNAHRPSVTALEGVLAGDDASALIAALVYDDPTGQTNAGSHTISVTLEHRNYRFSAKQETTYTITPVSASLVWSAADGTTPPQLVLTSAPYAGDISVTYTYYRVGEISPLAEAPATAGNYRVVANITFTTPYENYTFTNTETTYTIEQEGQL